MAVEYAKVLKAQNCKFTVIGRGEVSAIEFTNKTNVPVLTGGLDKAISSGAVPRASKTAIVSVGVEDLFDISLTLLKNGITRLLIEKPGVLRREQIAPLQEEAKKASAQVFIAYNRRFLSSVRKARKIIEADGGLTSFTFDFTEWGHEIAPLKKGPGVKEMWLLGNSSHVIDLAFYLGGSPVQLNAFHSGSLDWHPNASKFSGSGISTSGCLFSYHADWDAPGRWSLEFCTNQHKLIFQPMETLRVMNKGSVQIHDVATDSDDARLDTEFKPGLFRQVESFLATETGDLCTLKELASNFEHFYKIAGYSLEAATTSISHKPSA